MRAYLARVIEPLRKCLNMIPPELRFRLMLTMPLNLVVALLESASAGSIYFLVKVVGDPQALRTMSVGWAIQRVFPHATHRTLVLSFIGMLAVFYFVKVAFTVWATISSRRALKRANERVAGRFFRAYIGAPYSLHFRRNSAEITAQINRVIPDTLGSVVNSYMQLFLEIIVGCGLLVTMYLAAPRVTITLFALTATVLFGLQRWSRAQLNQSGMESNRLIREQSRRVVESLAAIKEIKVLGREPYFLDRHAELVAQAEEVQMHKNIMDAVPRVIIEAVFAGAGLTAIAVYVLSQRNEVNMVPLLGLYAYGAFRLIPTANRVSMAIGDIRWRRPTLDRIYQEYGDIGVGSDIVVDRDGGRAMLGDRFRFEGVSFKYSEASPFALRDLSFEVERGKSCGIVGPTGAGKSTVIDLVLGLLDPLEGRISVDGTNVQQLGTRWKRSIGYVPQDIFISDDTVRNNVALGIAPSEVDDARVWQALAMAQLDGFVRDLPGGLGAEVGERGALLSGGQRQRIGIARALYHDPAVLVFDEATSSLDVATEADVTRAIEALLGIKTVIVVAHRLSTVRRCDRLLLLVNGRLQASGSYDELVQNEPLFRSMAVVATK